jgi:hypothetical protein
VWRNADVDDRVPLFGVPPGMGFTSMPRFFPADAVKAMLYGGEAFVD